MVSQFVLKVHSRCDLACDHCYMYEHADQTWRGRPAAMAPQTVRAAAERIAEHAVEHGLQRVQVILHGGEPLLLGVSGLRPVLARLAGVVGAATRLELGMQTNGVRLTPQVCDLLLHYGVRVGVSLDGDAGANDRHRRFANGSSSRAEVLRALELLRRPEYHQIYGGILCTVDVANDPIAVYEALAVERPPHIDFLLPHATWDRPPPSVPGRRTPYSDWLGAVYDRWQADGCPMPIRLFDSLRALVSGGWSATEALGLAPVDLVVIETDGAWEQADSLKTAYHGAPGTQMNVFSHSVSEVTRHPGMLARQGRIDDLCATCRSCPVVRQCGGGLYAHRYRSGSGFDNPSVYCEDLKALVRATERKSLVPAGHRKETAVLPPSILDGLGTGYGDPNVLRYLATAQLSFTRALVADVGSATIAAGTRDPLSRIARAGWEALEGLDRDYTDSVLHVMRHPYLRSWARRCRDAPHALEHRAYLACLAVAGAVHARATLSLQVPVIDGSVVVPTLGRVAVPGPSAHGVAGVEVDAGRLCVLAGPGRPVHVNPFEAEGKGWQPTWRMEMYDRPILLEDTDPYRDCFEQPVARRMTAEAADRWRRQLAAAFDEILFWVPGQRAGLREVLTSVAPLAAHTGGDDLSAAARDAFGAVAIAPVEGAEKLAELLVHEIQHVKLGAVLDLCALIDHRHPMSLRVPWRDDPRPPEAVLQGTYAHLSVADLWRSRWVNGQGDLAALERFHLYRKWTQTGVRVLRQCGVLTPAGGDLVDRIEATVNSWHGDQT
ncbi:MAG TPA: FxsB family cyclophane-forming radical SAM/SPASM peptide maturase [Candidatus Limnocylindrales bacterium]|nr:FxsB family cyclophane-forming radical SAM/SPASM peptide maturase [Candidatus Limnocylindrales bacterium]